MKDWIDSEHARHAAALAGTTVVANVRKGGDEALVAWAKAESRFVYIGRASRAGYPASPWQNPFHLGKHGNREEIIAAYRDYLDHSPALKLRLPELHGKVLGCWCHPEPCHGDVLCEAVKKTAKAVADYRGVEVS